MIPRDATLRVVRPTDNLSEITAMYSKALGFEMLRQYKDQEGFDGVVVGHPKHGYHLEFTRQQGGTAGKAPTQDNLLVFYIDCSRVWERTCRNMIDSGFSVVESNNPYWENVGKTFEDIDGYRVVLQNRDWEI